MLRRILATCLLCTAAFAAPKTYQAVKATHPIKLDGKVDEAVWKNALCFNQFTIHDTNQPGFPAEARLLYDDDALYVAFVCPFPPGGTLKADVTKRDGNVYRDDCVEVMVDPNATGDRYFHFLANANGAIYDCYRDQGGFVGNEKWNGQIKAKAFKGKTFWSVEMRIPFSTLDINPDGLKEWGFNFCRDNRNPNQEASVAGGAFHNAGAFLKVKGLNLDLAKYGWSIAKPIVTGGRNAKGKLTATVKVNVGNQANIPQKAMIDVILFGKGGTASAAEKRQFAAKTTLEEKRENLILDKAGDFKCIISIMDPVTRKVYKRVTYPVKVDFAPLEIAIIKPAYRHAIFATQNLPEVIYMVKSPIAAQLAGGSIVTGIRDASGKVLVSKKLNAPGEVRFPAKGLPEGRMKIFVSATGKDGTKYAEATANLRKLPPHKGEVRMDEDGFWRVDGKRFFLIGEWNDIHTPGVTATMLNKEINDRSTKTITGDFMWSSSPVRGVSKRPTISAQDEEKIRAIARQHKDNPDFFAYYLMDEPEISGISAVGAARMAEIVRDEDPYHPLIVSNDTIAGIADFAAAGDINGLHPYPNPEPGVPKSNFNRFVAYMLQAEAFNRGRQVPQSIHYLQQGFNYGDYGSAKSRIPSFDEIRTQYLGSLVLGGRGIILYNRCTTIYPEIRLGVANVVKELNWYIPALLENNLPASEVNCSNDKVRFIAKKHNGELLILALQTVGGKETAAFKGPALAGKKLYVVGEERTVTAKNNAFADSFNNYQLHVYSTVKPPAELPTLAATEAAIAKANAQRYKPGNLAFQPAEYAKLRISASSNAVASRRPDCCLWHVTDGVVPDDNIYFVQQQRWEAKNPGDKWIELDFKQPVAMSRVVIYPAQNSLKDFMLQVEENGKQVTVAQVKNASGTPIEVKFAPRKSAKLKLVVTATNGPAAKVYEIEVYEK